MVQSEAFIYFSIAMIQSTSDLRVLARQVDAVSNCQQELVPILSTDKQETREKVSHSMNDELIEMLSLIKANTYILKKLNSQGVNK